MVVFTCNHCGESLKKQAVEKHYNWQKCRGAPVFLTCVDCLKDFRQDAYVAHTKCISEAERYYGKDYQAKPTQNKGQKKQEAWIDIIQSILQRNDLSSRLHGILQTLTKHENVPRKKPKFLNFMKNVSRQTSEYDATRIFDLIEEAYQKAREVQKVDTENGHEEKNGNCEENHEEQSTVKKKKKKGKADKSDNGVQEEITEKVQEDEKPKKKRKKHENAEQVAEEKHENGVEATDEMPKDKKSKKKRKKHENCETEESAQADDAVEPKKKKKKQESSEKISAEDIPEALKDEKTTEEKSSPKGHKRKEVIEKVKESVEEQERFPWNETIRKILEKAGGNLGEEKLKKRLLKKYLKLHPERATIQNTIGIIVNRRLRKMKKVSVDGDVVTLKA